MNYKKIITSPYLPVISYLLGAAQALFIGLEFPLLLAYLLVIPLVGLMVTARSRTKFLFTFWGYYAGFYTVIFEGVI